MNLSTVFFMRRALFLLTLFPLLLFSDKGTIEEVPLETLIPWFTGPLIASSPSVVSVDHYNIEPYFVVTKIPSLYNNDWHTKSIPSEWRIQVIAPMWVGLAEWCDLSFTPTTFWTHKQGGGGAWALGDVQIAFDFQIWDDTLPHKSWVPAIKLGIGEVIPTGKYRNLNPHKLSTDQGGLGTCSTFVELVLGRIFHFTGPHFLGWRFSCNYTIYNSIVHVKGYNAYGGGMGANGRVFPGRNVQLDMSFEYSLTKNWALALDIIGYWQAKSKFVGYAGTNFLSGTQMVVAQESAIQYSLAPAIEYNWNANLGIIAGAWFTVAGKNISEFFNFVFAVNYYK